MTMNPFARVQAGRYENDDFAILRFSATPPSWGLFRKTPVGLRHIAQFKSMTGAKTRVGEIYRAICEMEG